MTTDEIVLLIERDFELTYSPEVTKVTYKDGTIHAGFFYNFDDYSELKSNYLFRFIPANNSVAFRDDTQNHNGRPDKKFSIVIDATKIQNIEQVIPSQIF